jgi:preprotein translocase subunit SecG
MNTSAVPAVRTQALVGIGVFILGIWVAWQLGDKIAAEDLRTLEYCVLAIAGIAVVVTTLRDWRNGFYVFLVWLLFEDLVRKFLGNNLAIYFGKDVLVGMIYVAFFLEVRRGNVKIFTPRFLLFFYPCLFLCIAGIMNPYSPSILYGLMGFKLNFYYMPLMFVGYGLIRNDEDLRKFMMFNLLLALVVGGLGITQAIVGNSFLNPTNMAPELRELGQMERITPVSGQHLAVPSSVFVSAGRYSEYLMLIYVVAFGTAGYILLHTDRGRKLAYLALGGIMAATLFCGARGAVAYMFISTIALTAMFLWGAPWRWRQAHRLVKSIVRTFIMGVAALILILILFPQEIAPRIAFYTESFDPNSSGYEVGNRTWDYPIRNLKAALDQPTWLTGMGLGTASLGGQYVSKLLHQPPVEVWVEEGYGQLILELGVLGPILWLLWTIALMYFAWGVTRKLKQTRFFPIAMAITWYAFLLLFPFTYGGLQPYQNFVDNAYFWTLIGVLFKLPTLQAVFPNAPLPAAKPKRLPPNWARPHAPQFQ